MAEQLQSVLECNLNVRDDQLRAVGHVALQWAFLEGDIDREILWLNKHSIKPVKLAAKFEDRADGWRRMATVIYAGHPELIEEVA